MLDYFSNKQEDNLFLFFLEPSFMLKSLPISIIEYNFPVLQIFLPKVFCMREKSH